jgi:hypothetical protein
VFSVFWKLLSEGPYFLWNLCSSAIKIIEFDSVPCTHGVRNPLLHFFWCVEDKKDFYLFARPLTTWALNVKISLFKPQKYSPFNLLTASSRELGTTSSGAVDPWASAVSWFLPGDPKAETLFFQLSQGTSLSSQGIPPLHSWSSSFALFVREGNIYLWYLFLFTKWLYENHERKKKIYWRLPWFHPHCYCWALNSILYWIISLKQLLWVPFRVRKRLWFFGLSCLIGLLQLSACCSLFKLSSLNRCEDF